MRAALPVITFFGAGGLALGVRGSCRRPFRTTDDLRPNFIAKLVFDQKFVSRFTLEGLTVKDNFEKGFFEFILPEGVELVEEKG